ncbi:MAG: hypothetical protein WD426_19520 [Anditalea sp.]
MKKYLPYIILITVSILFFWISSRSYTLQASELESLELFRFFRGISNLIAFFVPLVLFVFYMLTSGLMFTLLDENFDSKKMAWIVSWSFIPVIFNCLIYLIVLYDIKIGGTLQEMLYHRSFLGLSLGDMEQVSYIFWLGFYLFFAVLVRHDFGLSYGKAALITITPTLLVVIGRYFLHQI